MKFLIVLAQWEAAAVREY